MSDFWLIMDLIEADKPGNEALKSMVDCYRDGSKLMQDEPETAIMHFKNGRDQAVELDKARWVLLYDHWTIQTLMFYMQDYNTALELSVKATIDARKPELAACPTRVCVHEDLISAYMGRDPIGYTEQIEDAIQYMEEEVDKNSNCHFCLRGRRISFELVHKRVDNAYDEAMQLFSSTTEKTHYHIHAISDLIYIAYLRKDYPEILRLARLGEPLAFEKDRREFIIAFKAWEVLALYQCGDAHHEIFLMNLYDYSQSMSRITSDAYYDALCAYYEAKGNLDTALQMRDKQVALKAGGGQYYYEYHARLEQCRLRKKLGMDTDDALAELHQVVDAFTKPEQFLAEIETVMNGEQLHKNS